MKLIRAERQAAGRWGEWRAFDLCVIFAERMAKQWHSHRPRTGRCFFMRHGTNPYELQRLIAGTGSRTGRPRIARVTSSIIKFRQPVAFLRPPTFRFIRFPPRVPLMKRPCCHSNDLYCINHQFSFKLLSNENEVN